MRARSHAVAALVLLVGLGGSARAQQPDAARPLLVLFSLQGDERLAEILPLLNAEIFMALEKAGRHRLMSQDELADHLIMDPVENLAFCNQEPGCISDLAADVQAALVLYGDVKLSFDGQKVIVHLVLVDARARTQAGERFGQLSREGTVVAEAGDLVRDLLGLPALAPAPVKPEVAEGAGSEEAGGPPEAPPTPARDQAPPAATVQVESGPSPWSNPWMWASFGVGLAGIGTGVVLGVLAGQKQTDAESAANQARPVEALGLVRDAEDLAVGANIAYGVGGGLLLTAVILVIVDATREPEPGEPAAPAVAPGLSCSPEGCGATLTLPF